MAFEKTPRKKLFDDLEDDLESTRDAFSKLTDQTKRIHERREQKKREHPATPDSSTTNTPDTSPQKPKNPSSPGFGKK